MADPVAGPVADDPAAVGFALLMAGVETAVASAAEEIAALGHVVQQGFVGRPPLSPPTMPATSAMTRKPAGTVEPAGQPQPMTAPQPALPALPSGSAAQPYFALQPATSEPRPVTATAVLKVHSGAAADGGSAQAPAIAPSRAARGEVQVLPRAASWPEPASLGASALATSAAPAAPFGAPAAPLAIREAARLALPAAYAPAADTQSGFPAAPVAAVPPEAPLQPAAVAPNASRGQSVAPAGREAVGSPSSTGSGGGAMHGDVFLDGVRVGHWLSEALARAAGGPARGGTAFDPRMGPRWPGALQGQ